MVLAGDNGAENLLIRERERGRLWRAPSSHPAKIPTRTPCLIRWPGEIASEPAPRTSSFIRRTCSRRCSHGPRVLIPDDREIDGVDQRTFFSGSQDDLEPRGVPRLGHRRAPRRQMAELQSRIRATPLQRRGAPRSWPRQVDRKSNDRPEGTRELNDHAGPLQLGARPRRTATERIRHNRSSASRRSQPAHRLTTCPNATQRATNKHSEYRHAGMACEWCFPHVEPTATSTTRGEPRSLPDEEDQVRQALPVPGH